MTLHRRFLLSAVAALALTGTACAQNASQGAPRDEAGNPLEALTVVTASGEHAFWVEIADDDAERARGLMFRDPLADDRGMLFQFPDMAERGFWMENTPSSLDIIYIDDTGASSRSPGTPRRSRARPSRPMARPRGCWRCARAAPRKSARAPATRCAIRSSTTPTDRLRRSGRRAYKPRLIGA